MSPSSLQGRWVLSFNVLFSPVTVCSLSKYFLVKVTLYLTSGEEWGPSADWKIREDQVPKERSDLSGFIAPLRICLFICSFCYCYFAFGEERLISGLGKQKLPALCRGTENEILLFFNQPTSLDMTDLLAWRAYRKSMLLLLLRSSWSCTHKILRYSERMFSIFHGKLLC